MKTLGYIVTEKKLSGVYGFVKQVSDVSDADLTKPTLIVGWELAKQFDGYNILDRRLGDNLFWTFSRTENRSTLESDLMKFYECNMPYIRKVVDMIKQELFMERIAIDKTHPCGERKGFLEVRGVSRPQLLLGVHVLDFQRDGRHAQARRVFL